VTGPRSLAGIRVAVTGASGFCGATVARAAAAAGADVVCLGRRPGPVGRHVRWDAASDTPDLAGADIVVHLAAAVADGPAGNRAELACHAVNVDGTRRLLAAAGGRAVVWVSSASVYDPRCDRSLVGEDHPIGGQLNAYGRTKAAGERLALAAGAVVLRPRAVYGPGDPHLVPRLLALARAGIVALPGPDVRLSLTAAANLADACLAAPSWPAGAFNIADAAPYWRDTVVREVLRAHGISARLVHVPVAAAMFAATAARPLARLRPSAPPRLTRYAVDQVARPVVLDITKAAAQGWRPRHELAGYLAAIAAGPAGSGAGLGGGLGSAGETRTGQPRRDGHRDERQQHHEEHDHVDLR
jgi:nucleoside-diphosphate-sugar epimerase